MATKISDMPSAVILNDNDLFEVEQAGVNRKMTWAEFRNVIVFSLGSNVVPIAGDTLGWSGTRFVASAASRWRVVPQAAYTEASATSFQTIEFAGGAPVGGINLRASDYFAIGMPVRVVISGAAYYGICTAVSDTVLTFRGANIPLAIAITSLSVGSSDMVKHVQMGFAGASYNTSTIAALTKGCRHRWRGPTGHLCAFSCAHVGAAAGTRVTLHMNGGASVNGSNGVIPAAGTATTYGAFVDDTAIPQIIRTLCAISDNQVITAMTPTIGAAAGDLIICMTFVVP